MKALTVWQPSAWAIVAGHKDVENRSWATHYRGPVLIHAAKGFNPEIAVWMRQKLGLDPPLHYTHSAILGVVEITDCTRTARSHWSSRAAGGGWSMYCWHLANAQAIEPVPCSGRQGFWRPEPEVLEVAAGRLGMK
jgi:hypothetical protein